MYASPEQLMKEKIIYRDRKGRRILRLGSRAEGGRAARARARQGWRPRARPACWGSRRAARAPRSGTRPSCGARAAPATGSGRRPPASAAPPPTRSARAPPHTDAACTAPATWSAWRGTRCAPHPSATAIAHTAAPQTSSWTPIHITIIQIYTRNVSVTLHPSSCGGRGTYLLFKNFIWTYRCCWINILFR